MVWSLPITESKRAYEVERAVEALEKALESRGTRGYPAVPSAGRNAESEPENRSGYEGWLNELAGKRVATLPIFLAWAMLVGGACAAAYVAGLRNESEFTGVTALYLSRIGR